MSDTNVENAVDNGNDIDQELTEALQELGSSEEQTSDDESTPEVAEVDLSDVDLEGITGTQPIEEKKRNNAYARMRVKLKEAEKRLEKDSFDAVPEGKKPRRVDFLNPDVVDDKFNGSESLAMAAFEDAMDDWNFSKTQAVSTKRKETKTNHDSIKKVIEAQEEFETKVDEVRPTLKGIDELIYAAEEALTFTDANGNEQDCSMVIKTRYKDDAPFMLAALGKKPEVARALMEMPDQFEVINSLNKLRDQVRKVKPSQQVSQAPQEEPVVGSNKATMSKLEREIEAAANAGDYKLYRQLTAKIRS